MHTDNTRRFEMGLPLLPDLGVDSLLESCVQVAKGNAAGLATFYVAMAKAGTSKAFRKLAAIARASDLELKHAEEDPAAMAQLEAEAADLPFAEAFKAVLDFHAALLRFLGVTLGSSGDPAAAPDAKEETSDASPSGA